MADTCELVARLPGKPTDDPSRALEGVMLPMGGPKGSGLAIMMDVFSGVLSGAYYTPEQLRS